MADINIKFTGTDIVAWWGAIIATAVLIWDVYKWRTSGPKIKFFVQPNTLIVGDLNKKDGKYIAANVTNVGDRPTTITHFVFQHYKSYIKMLRHKPDTSMVVLPITSQPIPYILNPGDIWQGLAIQTSEVEELSKNGYLVCGICHSHSDKEIDRRVIINGKP